MSKGSTQPKVRAEQCDDPGSSIIWLRQEKNILKHLIRFRIKYTTHQSLLSKKFRVNFEFIV